MARISKAVTNLHYSRWHGNAQKGVCRLKKVLKKPLAETGIHASLYWTRNYPSPWNPHKTTSNTETTETRLRKSQSDAILSAMFGIEGPTGAPSLSGPEEDKRSDLRVPVTRRHQKLVQSVLEPPLSLLQRSWGNRDGMIERQRLKWKKTLVVFVLWRTEGTEIMLEDEGPNKQQLFMERRRRRRRPSLTF